MGALARGSVLDARARSELATEFTPNSTSGAGGQARELGKLLIVDRDLRRGAMLAYLLPLGVFGSLPAQRLGEGHSGKLWGVWEAGPSEITYIGVLHALHGNAQQLNITGSQDARGLRGGPSGRRHVELCFRKMRL